MSETVLHRLAWVFVAICVAPILAAGLSAFTGDLQTWREVLSSVLPRYTWTTLVLVVVVGGSTAVIGSITAYGMQKLIVPVRCPALISNPTITTVSEGATI